MAHYKQKKANDKHWPMRAQDGVLFEGIVPQATFSRLGTLFRRLGSERLLSGGSPWPVLRVSSLRKGRCRCCSGAKDSRA